MKFLQRQMHGLRLKRGRESHERERERERESSSEIFYLYFNLVLPITYWSIILVLIGYDL